MRLALEQRRKVEQGDDLVEIRPALGGGREPAAEDEVTPHAQVRQQQPVLEHVADAPLLGGEVDACRAVEQQALADGELNPGALATLAAPRLRATPEQLCDAFNAAATLHPVYRRLLTLTLEELRLIEDHLGQLDQQMADLLTAHHDAVQRLAEVPGLGVDSAQADHRGGRRDRSSELDERRKGWGASAAARSKSPERPEGSSPARPPARPSGL